MMKALYLAVLKKVPKGTSVLLGRLTLGIQGGPSLKP